MTIRSVIEILWSTLLIALMSVPAVAGNATLKRSLKRLQDELGPSKKTPRE